MNVGNTYLEGGEQLDDVGVLKIHQQFFFSQNVPFLVQFQNLPDAHRLYRHVFICGFLDGQAYFSKGALSNMVVDCVVGKF